MSGIHKSAVISDCGMYRYRLERYWGPGDMLQPFIMLNPSTADAEVDDPTIRRCIHFAQREGAAGIVVVNLFAFRATSPADMHRAAAPHGPDNEATLTKMAMDAVTNEMPIICAWGTGGGATALAVTTLLECFNPKLVCLGKTKDGHPRHPLYVRGDQPLEVFP